MDHSQAIIGGCQSLKFSATAWTYWESLSSFATPGNQPARLATSSSEPITAIEVGLVVVAPTRDSALTPKPMVPSGMCSEICPIRQSAVRIYLIKGRGQWTSEVRLQVDSPVPILNTLPLHPDAPRIADLDPHRTRPRSISAVDLLGDDALDAKPASVRERGRTVLCEVFVEQDARIDVAQQSRHRGLAVEERAMQDRGPRGLQSAQFVEARQPVGPEHDSLSIDREAFRLDPRRSRGDRR